MTSTLLLCLLIPIASFAQEVRIKSSNGEEGQGVIRGRKNECFVVTVNHVVEKAEEIEVIGDKTVTYSVGKPVIGDSSNDLAVLPLSGAGNCEAWPPAENVEAMLGGKAEGNLKMRDTDNSIGLIPVYLTKISAKYFVIKPKDSSDPIKTGMSGSSLIVNGARVGLVRELCVDPNGCSKGVVLKTGEASVIRIDAAMLALESFFGSAPKYDLATAVTLLDRAIKARDGSDQGQVAAIESLLKIGFNFKNTAFNGVSLAGANIPGVDFSSSSFFDGNFSNAKLDNAILHKAQLSFSDLQSASFRGVKAEEAYFQYTHADYNDGKEAGVSFEGATLNRSSFFLSRLRGANFRNANLQGVCLAFCDLTGADFTGADLTHAIIYSSVLDNAKFEGAIIKNTDVDSSVADTISFTPEQRDELRRATPLNSHIDVKIWGKARDSASWNASYPDFSSYWLIPIRSNDSLKFRDSNALQPIGPFQHYGRDHSTIARSYYSFDADFWNKAGRSQRIIRRLDDYGRVLTEQISKQALIKGSGKELKAWMDFIEKNSQIVSHSGPLVWTDEAHTMLLLSKGIISPTGINYWNSLAVERCRLDTQYNINVGRDNWNPMYPPDAVCHLLPQSHIDTYKKWTIARSQKQAFQQIEVTFPVRLADLERAQKAKSKENTSRGQMFTFDDVQPAGAMPGSPQYQKIAFQLAPMMRFGIGPGVFNLPAARSQYSMAMKPNQTLAPTSGKSSYDTFVYFRITFDLSEIVTKDGTNYEFAVTPKKAKIEIDENRIWEGPILLNDKK
jgi:uncharacterized protein YjbI with pentapeptide repeats